jgi:hypothetical protein
MSSLIIRIQHSMTSKHNVVCDDATRLRNSVLGYITLNARLITSLISFVFQTQCRSKRGKLVEPAVVSDDKAEDEADPHGT